MANEVLALYTMNYNMSLFFGNCFFLYFLNCRLAVVLGKNQLLKNYKTAVNNGYKTYQRQKSWQSTVTPRSTMKKSCQVNCIVTFSFVMGKSRIAPIMSVTIPCMKLSAAVTTVKINKVCQMELTLPVEETRSWTDCICVLK